MCHKNHSLTDMHICPIGQSTDFSAIGTGILQNDTLAPYLLIICLLRTSIDIIKKMALHKKKMQEADDIPKKLLRTRTM